MRPPAVQWCAIGARPDPDREEGTTVVMFVLVVVTMMLGQVVHIALDRSPRRGTRLRRRELGLLWVVGGSGFWVLVDGLLYLDPRTSGIVPAPGAAPALAHWELAWADITLGLLLLGCIPRRNRGSWTDAAVFALVLLQGSDAVGNLIQIFVRREYTDVHIWSIPTELVQAVLAVIYLRIYRTWSRHTVVTAPDAAASPVTVPPPTPYRRRPTSQEKR
jgi:hypothetical protein